MSGLKNDLVEPESIKNLRLFFEEMIYGNSPILELLI